MLNLFQHLTQSLKQVQDDVQNRNNNRHCELIANYSGKQLIN